MKKISEMKTMSKMKKMSWIFSFLLLIYIIPLAGSFLSERGDTSQEKRKMNEKPEFHMAEYAAFPKKYEAYFNDTVPFRNQMIEINNALTYFVFHSSPDPKVILGDDGWLFYSATLVDYAGVNLYSEEELSQIADNLSDNQRYLAQQGIEFVLFLAPNKNTIYGEYMPQTYGQTAWSRCDQVADYLREQTDIPVIYAKDALLTAKAEHPELELYHRTDTHWNYAGGYIGARTLIEALGVQIPPIGEVTLQEKSVEGGDLSAMMGLKKYFTGEKDFDVSGYTDNHILASQGTNLDAIEYRTDSPVKTSIMVNRDSFGDGMQKVIGSVFEKSYMPSREYYKKEMIFEQSPDIFVLEIVERELEGLKNFDVRVDGSLRK